MKIDRTEIALRERPFWESVDVGSLMYRRWLGPIAVFFLVPFAVAVAGLLIASPHLPAWLPALALWWLNPLWDRLVLVPAGVRLFDPEAPLRTAVGMLGRVFSLSLAADLSWRRFNPLRAYMIPVSMYERLPLKQRAQRKHWLRRGAVWRFIGLAALFLGLEALVGGSLIFSQAFLTNIGLVTTRARTPIIGTPLFLTTVYALAVAIVEPLYALSSFAAYVNRRTATEGWDLQLAFSRLRSRLRTDRGRTILMVVVLLFSLQTVRVQAQAAAPPPSQPGASAFVERAHQVLKGDEFGKTVTKRRLVLHFGGAAKKARAAGAGNRQLLLLLARLLEFLAVAVAATLVVFVILRNRRRILAVARSAFRSKTAIVRERETDDGDERAPDWIDASRRAWNAGQFREALAVLYRGALSLARSRYGIAVSPSATEGECLRVLEDAGSAPAFLTTFTQLSDTWVRLAWAGVVPGTDEFERITHGLARLGEKDEPQ